MDDGGLGMGSCKCGCGEPPRDGSRYATDACRARASRQRRQFGIEPGRITRCQLNRRGEVSITIHLPATWVERMEQLQPGRWLDVQPRGGRE